jgi:hypothetical protein
MRNEVHTRGAALLLGALLIAVLLPVTVLFSREEASAPDVPSGDGFTVAASIARPRVDPMAVASTYVGWRGDAAQSASMVIVGTLLIGIGSIVRRGMSL